MPSAPPGPVAQAACRPLRFLLLYGSLREGSNSQRLVRLAARSLEALGAETVVFDPHGLPLPDGTNAEHPRGRELRRLAAWADGHVWCSPEWHGTLTGVFKNQIDWFPYQRETATDARWPTLAVMQLSGGPASFNAVNGLRLLGRWMRFWSIPSQLSIGQAGRAFDAAGDLLDPALAGRLAGTMQELYRFTEIMRRAPTHSLPRPRAPW